MNERGYLLSRFWLIISLGFVFSSLLPLNSFAAPRRNTNDKTVYVHLFEWTWKDIALECETFLGPKGFRAVQVSPPNEHAVLPNNPWFERYQPVSYQLTTRSGTRDEFIDMVKRCKAQGVDIYVDAVLNHMSWVNRSGRSKYGVGGSPYDEYSYAGLYSPNDFHRCGKNGDDSIQNYQDRWEVQNCNLTTCADLKTESTYVRGKLASYLQDLIDIGVAGFRIDAAKHIPVTDLQTIFSMTNQSYYVYQEVIDYGSEPIKSSEYFMTGDVIEFRFARQLAHTFNSGQLSWLGQFGQTWGFVPDRKAIVFVDNHDLQRGHGGGGEVLTHKDGQKYTLANIFMLAWPYGYPQVMSSYRFNDSSQGPPSTGVTTKRVFSGSRTTCGQDWICEHRWAPIANMVGFRNYTQSTPVQKWWSNGKNLISFARGNSGYVVINKESQGSDRWFDTGLPSGSYCDVISGDVSPDGRRCTGPTIFVNEYGWAQISVGPNNAVAIHGGARPRTR
ncbi:MAG: ATPase [Bdellovibrionales bacterium RIFOXYC1_FULL_54_43]|nr:MAG: ATPase [Bdellovibrionales bacterium RIFOXYC1_FULL_54_43]OFZ85219.1 MAG: ATPase [Bdellovibrionales bacterium RIFOXYD1_FULL_55_31]